MAPNVYTKNEILQNLAAKGYFIDAYTLDTFFKKWRVDAIFEDQNGHEFFDKNALDLVMTNLFSSQTTQEKNKTDEIEQNEQTLEQISEQIPEHFEKSQEPLQQEQLQQEQLQNIELQQQSEIKYQNEPIQTQKHENDINNNINNINDINIENVDIQENQTEELPLNEKIENENSKNSFSNYEAPQKENIEIISMEEDISKAEENSQDFKSPQENSQKFQINDAETVSILNNISLSDGTSLMDKINSQANSTFTTDTISQEDYEKAMNIEPPKPEAKSVSSGILAGAMQSNIQNDIVSNDDILPVEVIAPVEQKPSEFSQIVEQNEQGQFQNVQNEFSDNNENKEEEDFDDISLLSESLEAQEKLREYVVSQLSKKNLDVTPQKDENNLDISEKMLSMIAKAMAKKLVNYINATYASDAKAQIRLTLVQEEYKKLDKKYKELEEKNKKLKLLLAETNRNLNSYQPSIFGLYKKIKPKKN